MVNEKSSSIELLKKYYELSSKKFNEYMPDNFMEYIVKEANDNDNFILKKPLLVTWDITRRCNLICEFCSANAKATSCKKELTIDEDLKIVKKLIKANVVQVVLQGGEPFLKKGILEVIDELVNNNIYVEVITNATLIDREIAQKLGRLKKEFIRVKVSLDGSCSEINDKIRGKGSFKKALNAIRLLKEYDIYVRIQSVATNENLQDMINIYRLACDEKVDSFGFTPVLPIGRGINSIVPDIEGVINQAIQVKEYELNHINSIPTHIIRLGYIQNMNFIEKLNDVLEDRFLKGEKAFLQHCTCGKSKMEIDCDGQVYTCAFLRYDEFSAGNLLNGELDELWNTPIWDVFRNVRRCTKKKCKDCNLLWCNTGCTALAYNKFNTFYQNDPNCEYKK